MPFVNELVTDADIDDYGLPFEKGRPRYWTHDQSTRRYLWGGMSGNPAFDDICEARFRLFAGGKLYYIVLEPGSMSSSFKEKPYRLEWKRVTYINPSPDSEAEQRLIIDNLKEALTVYGADGRTNKFAPARVIDFCF